MVTFQEAHEIAEKYREKYGIKGVIDSDKTTFYSTFYNVEGPVWLVIVQTPPSPLEGDDEVTIVVSIDRAEVNHIINRSGFDKYPHLDE